MYSYLRFVYRIYIWLWLSSPSRVFVESTCVFGSHAGNADFISLVVHGVGFSMSSKGMVFLEGNDHQNNFNFTPKIPIIQIH